MSSSFFIHHVKRKLRFCQPLDIYTTDRLSLGNRTIEHVIPQSILKKAMRMEYNYSNNYSNNYDNVIYHKHRNHHRNHHDDDYGDYRENRDYPDYPDYRRSPVLMDPLNLFVTSSTINSFRSNYKFGMLNCQLSAVALVDDSKKLNRDILQRDTKRCTFFPIVNQRLLAHTVLNMYRRYPRLEEWHNDIFADEDILDQWLRKPYTAREQNMLQWKWLVFGDKSI